MKPTIKCKVETNGGWIRRSKTKDLFLDFNILGYKIGDIFRRRRYKIKDIFLQLSAQNKKQQNERDSLR